MPAKSPSWRNTKTLQDTTHERTGMEGSLRERRGGDALPSPRPPFSFNFTKGNSSPRSEHSALHTSPSSSSLRPPHSPSPSLTGSIVSLTPSQAPSYAPSFTPSFAPSFTPSFTPSTDSRRGMFRRAHRSSTSASPPSSMSISHSQWQPAMPSTIVNGEARPGHGGRSVSDSLMPTAAPKPKLQRKKSNASLLYQGLGRGLSRVGSVMRRSSNSSINSAATADPTTPAARGAPTSPGSTSLPPRTTSRRPPPPKRCGSTTLQDLCEEAEAAERDAGSSRALASTSTPTAASTHAEDGSVSRPFNVQHELHVTPDLDGLPSEWLESLKAQGVTEHDLLLIASAQRRQRSVVLNPIVRTFTPIDTSRPPSPSTSKYATSPATTSSSPVKTEEATVVITGSPLKDQAPLKKGSPEARTSTPTLPSPTQAQVAQSSTVQLSPPPQHKSGRGRRRSPTVTSPQAANRRSLSAPDDKGATVKRSASLLGKLLDDLDSKSSRPSIRRAHTDTLVPPAKDHDDDNASEGSDLAGRPLPSQTHEQLQKRLSDELRGFHDIMIPEEDGWAASILAAWDGDNALSPAKAAAPVALARHLTVDGPRRPEAVATPEPGAIPSSSFPSRAPSPDVSPYLGKLSKPRSVSSLCIPSVDVDDVDDESSGYFPRRRSQSFDQHIVDRSTLYSPPPPPPHPQHNNATAGDTPPTSFRSPHGGRLRASRDSFGVAHSISTRSSLIATSFGSQRSIEENRKSERKSDDEDEDNDITDESHGTPGPSPSRTSSELDLGTPPASEDMSGGKVSAHSGHSKDHSLIHERLSVASQLEQGRCGRPFSIPSEPTDAPTTATVESYDDPHRSLRSEDFHRSLRSEDFHRRPEAPLSIDTSPLPTLHSPVSSAVSSTMAHPYSPSEEDFFDTYLGVGWCAACHATPSNSIGNLPAANSSALGLSLNPISEHTCSLGLGRHGSVRSLASSYSYAGADRTSVLSVGGTSQLSRMSSIASSTHSYNLHEVTVHRAYTRVLRRVPERSETVSSEADASESGGIHGDGSADGETSTSVDVWESARHSMQSANSGMSGMSRTSAISALDEAARRVAIREGCV